MVGLAGLSVPLAGVGAVGTLGVVGLEEFAVVALPVERFALGDEIFVLGPSTSVLLELVAATTMAREIPDRQSRTASIRRT